MNVKTAYLIVQDRLNKLSTNHNQKITERQFVYAFNKMQLHWFEQRIKGEEVDKVRQEELQQFVVDYCKPPTNNKKGKFYELKVPEDYFHYKRVSAEASKAGCTHTVYGRASEESAMNTLLKDSFQKPSFDWQDSLFSIANNTIIKP